MKNAILHVISASLCIVLFMSQIVTSQDLAGPPQRPEVFRNPQELRSYLKSLNEYFAIVGRPRFGRSVSKRSIDDYKRAFNTFQGLDIDGDGIISTSDLAYFSAYTSGR